MSYESFLFNTVDLIEEITGDWGEPTESVTSGVKCRIMYGNKLVRDFRGEQVLSFAKIFFLPAQEIRHTMKVRIKDTADPTKTTDHSIIKIGQPQDSTKLHHKEVWVS